MKTVKLIGLGVASLALVGAVWFAVKVYSDIPTRKEPLAEENN